MPKQTEQARVRKQRQRERDKKTEMRDILQWGIDTGRVRVRDDVALEYDLTQSEPCYGPAKLTKVELLTLLNNDIKAKKIDAPLYFLDDRAESGFNVLYAYSKDWYK